MPIPSQKDEELLRVLADRLEELGEDTIELNIVDGWGPVLRRLNFADQRIHALASAEPDERFKIYAWIVSILREEPRSIGWGPGWVIPGGFTTSQKTWHGSGVPSHLRWIASVYAKNSDDTARIVMLQGNEIPPDRIYDRRGTWQFVQTDSVLRDLGAGPRVAPGIMWVWYVLSQANREPGLEGLGGHTMKSFPRLYKEQLYRYVRLLRNGMTGSSMRDAHHHLTRANGWYERGYAEEAFLELRQAEHANATAEREYRR